MIERGGQVAPAGDGANLRWTLNPRHFQPPVADLLARWPAWSEGDAVLIVQSLAQINVRLGNDSKATTCKEPSRASVLYAHFVAQIQPGSTLAGQMRLMLGTNLQNRGALRRAVSTTLCAITVSNQRHVLTLFTHQAYWNARATITSSGGSSIFRCLRRRRAAPAASWRRTTRSRLRIPTTLVCWTPIRQRYVQEQWAMAPKVRTNDGSGIS